MKKNLLFKLTVCCFLTTLFISCSNDDIDEMCEDNVTSMSLTYDESLERFGVMLSKAVSSDREVRKFVKAQALKKIDNGYNIFYPLAKDEKVTGDKTFRDVLCNCAANPKELVEIEKNLPLLNIHMPEFDTVSVTALDVESDDLPVLVNKKLFLNGELIDTIGDLEIPAFNVLVVTESSTIKKKTAATRSNLSLSLSGEYEYRNIAFVPRSQVTRTTLYDEDMINDDFETTENRNYDIEKYHGTTLPISCVDPRLVNAFNGAGDAKYATRCMMYYNLKNTSEPINVNKRLDCQDLIYRFKLTEDEFLFYNSYQSDSYKYFKDGSIYHKGSHWTRKQVLDLLKTGTTIDFVIHIVDTAFHDIAISAQPEDLFNVSINYTYRHSTAFRSSKHTYSIDKLSFKSKWYYPYEHGVDFRLGRWDVFNNSIDKHIFVYFMPTKVGTQETITEESTVTRINKNSVDAKIGVEKLFDTLNVNVNYNGSWSTTVTDRITKQYTYTYTPHMRSDFYINYFDDYPVSSIYNGKVLFNSIGGSGPIIFNIMTVSNDFYNNHIINK